MRHYFQNYCKDYENIENYDKAKADDFIGWNCHHRLETHTSDGERRLVNITKKELKALGMFRKIGFLSNRQYLFTILTRFPVLVMPHYIRKFIYNKLCFRYNLSFIIYLFKCQ